jgi:hypothetical protein
MKKSIFSLAIAALALQASAQITFDTADYGEIGVYDTWEESPFRTGTLAGNAQVIDNCFNATTSGISNTTSKILGVQRSRFGSNTFGVKVGLPTPLATTETTQYVHVLVYKPNTTPVMLVGLGKRESFTDEPTTVEQFWVTSNYTPVANQWCDMVFPIATVTGVKIYSWVVVPDLASPHTLTEDYACYIDQIEVNSSSSQRKGPFSGSTVDPDTDTDTETEVYAVSFDKTQTNTRETDNGNGIRYLKGVTLTASDNTAQSYTPDTSDDLYHLVYKDATSTVTFNVQAGQTYTPSVSYQGNWMHAYAYIDYDNDGVFTPEISNNKITSASEAVSYSGYNASTEETVYNSSGTTYTGSNRNTLVMPSFTIPSGTKPGIYRMRYKVDWNCIDPAGGDGSNTTNMQSIVDNGGGIVDVLLNVHADNVTVNAQHRNGTIVTSDDEALVNYSTPFNTAFGIVITPASGFENDNIVVKHGYNLEGEQYVNNNRQWSSVTYSASEFGSDGSLTIPADIVDGDISIQGNFAQKQYVQLNETEAMPTDKFGTADVLLTRSFVSGYYNTVCLPFSLTEAQYKAAFGSDTKVYKYVSTRNDGYLRFRTSRTIEANVPFLMTTSTTNTTFTFENVTLVDGTPSVSGPAYDFVGNYDGKITLSTDSYFLKNNTLYQSNGKSKMSGYRAYFSLHSGSIGYPVQLEVDGTVTGIESVVFDGDDEADTYTTDGVKMPGSAKRQKGVYISGGKKTLTK